MPAQPGLAHTFNSAVEAYDRFRPTYPEARRSRFFSELHEVISAFGGITVYDTIDLQLTRKPLS